jgi:hypothetical protein
MENELDNNLRNAETETLSDWLNSVLSKLAM